MLLRVFFVTVVAAIPARGEPTPLPLGQTQHGSADTDAATVYRVSVDSPGVLTVAVRSDQGFDLGVEIADVDGQTLPDGYGDFDDFGKMGDEQVAATLGAAGDYLVYVMAYEQQAGYVIGATFLPMPEAALPEDPHGRPGTAAPMEVGRKTGGTIRPARGDHYDWYVITPTRNGVMTIYTRGDDNVVLEAYEPGEYREAIAWADETDQTAGGNESISLDVHENEPLYVRVSTYAESADYVITAGMVGE